MQLRRFVLSLLLMAGSQLHGQVAWRERLAHAMPLAGSHNWIVLAEPAYPLLNSAGIEVVATDLSQTDLLTAVLNALAGARHVRPVFFTDAELPFIPEQDANGIKAYQAQAETMLKGDEVSSLPQDQLETKIEEASRSYHVLVLKSTTTLPYSTIFIQLESGYWSTDAERRLRAAMEPQK